MEPRRGGIIIEKENKSKYKPRRGGIKKSIDEPGGSLAISIPTGTLVWRRISLSPPLKRGTER
jgi:hypothetical protein